MQMNYVDYMDIYFQVYTSLYQEKQIYPFVKKLKVRMRNRK